MLGRRLLLVDDERSILDTLETIFQQQGYRVVAAATVADALQAISRQTFDVLIADLNIGQPGDGFTVVSALRRTQPDAIALILTGYPAFDNALQAIREQVDDFLVKPIHPLELVERVEKTVRSHGKHVPLPSKRVSDVLRSESESIVERLADSLRRACDGLGKTHLSKEDLINHLPELIEELCRGVDQDDDSISGMARKAAEVHGTLRASQGFDLLFLCDESTIIRREVLRTVHHNLLLLNLSYLFLDLARMSMSLDYQSKISVQAFLESQKSPTLRKS